MRQLIVLCVMLCVISACKKESNNTGNTACDAFNSITITGPTIAYIDSSFTLSAVSSLDPGYEWNHDYFTSSITGTDEITIDPVYPESGGTYTLRLIDFDNDCPDRLVQHTVEVRPKPFGNSPCTTTNNTAKINGSTFQVTFSSGEVDGGQYKITANGTQGDIYITLPLDHAPTADQVFNITQSGVTYNTAEMHMVAGGGVLSCLYYPTAGGKLYVKKKSTGVEYSFCGTTMTSDGACTGTSITTTADVKFTTP